MTNEVIEMAMSVGKAQAKVLDALGIQAWDNTEAADFFSLLGLRVTTRREGRDSVPVIEVTPRGRTATDGGWVNGEGDEWEVEVGRGLPVFDMTALMAWVTNPAEAEAITALASARHAPMPTRADLTTPAARQRVRDLW